LDDKGVKEPFTAQQQRRIAFREANWKKDFFAGLGNENCDLVLPGGYDAFLSL
jgi:hypothetical protein